MFISFVVTNEGLISDVEVIRDLGYTTGKAAIKAFKEMPLWIPAVKDGRTVSCRLRCLIL